MHYKIENDKLIPAPLNFRTPAGWIMNFNSSPELMNQYGFTLTEAEAEEWRKQHPQPPPPEQTIYSKLAIRRAMRELGIEEKLDGLLNASAQFRADWTDAQDIDLSDPVLIAALQAGSITAEEIAAVKRIMNGANEANEANE